jgi:hypothetical protein
VPTDILKKNSFFTVWRTGLCAGVILGFRPPGPLLIKNILMKFKLMLNNVCPAPTDAWLCNLLMLSLSSHT